MTETFKFLNIALVKMEVSVHAHIALGFNPVMSIVLFRGNIKQTAYTQMRYHRNITGNFAYWTARPGKKIGPMSSKLVR